MGDEGNIELLEIKEIIHRGYIANSSCNHTNTHETQKNQEGLFRNHLKPKALIETFLI
jgi:hypothetical protein